MTIYDGRESFYQWDLNQKITSDGFAIGDKIHFFNMRQSNALVVKAYELDGKIVADVPNILLQTALPLKVWRYVYGENSAKTIEEHIFNVVQRAQPYDYFYSETELYELRKEVDRLVTEGDEMLDELQVAKNNEAERIKAESDRVIEETKRVDAETLRANAESSRSTEESKRVIAEQSRATAEIERQNKEQERQDAETLRQTTFEQSYNNVANALKGSVSGEVVRMDDVSQLGHTVNGKVRSKNLFEPITPQTIEGVVVSIDADGTIHLNGTCTQSANVQFRKRLERSGTYYLADFATGTFPSNNEVRTQIYDDVNIVRLEITNASSTNVVREQSFEGSITPWFRIKVERGHTYNDCTLRPTLFYEEKPTEYTPYVDPTGVTVTRCGKNLLNDSIGSANNHSSFNKDRHTFNVIGNVGSAECAYDTGQLMFPWSSETDILTRGIPVISGRTYTITFDCLLVEQGVYSDKISVLLYDETLIPILNKKIAYTVGKKERSSITFTSSVTTNVGLTFRLNNNSWKISNVQIECCDTATDYEIYNGTTYTPSADGMVEVASLSPTMTLLTDTAGVTIEAEYNRDANVVINNMQAQIDSLKASITNLLNK